jgi:hypothetical protein
MDNLGIYFMTIWSLLRQLEKFYGHLVYFIVIWYIFPRFVFCTKKNLATLLSTAFEGQGVGFMCESCGSWENEKGCAYKVRMKRVRKLRVRKYVPL